MPCPRQTGKVGEQVGFMNSGGRPAYLALRAVPGAPKMRGGGRHGHRLLGLETQISVQPIRPIEVEGADVARRDIHRNIPGPGACQHFQTQTQPSHSSRQRMPQLLLP